MAQVDDDYTLGPTVRTMQIIICGLTLGLVFFLGIVLFLRMQPKSGPPQPAANPVQASPLISYVAIAFAALVVPMSVLIPGVVANSGRKQIAQGT